MRLPDFQPRGYVGHHPFCATFGALPHVIDVLSGVSLRVRSPRHRTCSESPFGQHFARHPLRHLSRIVLHAVAHIHARSDVRSNVQTACPERAMPAAWRAFAGRSAAPCAAPPGHRIPVPSGRGKMQGKIKGRGTSLREKPVCTWGWRGTRLIAAPCRVDSQCLVAIEKCACLARLAATVLDGGTV